MTSFPIFVLRRIFWFFFLGALFLSGCSGSNSSSAPGSSDGPGPGPGAATGANGLDPASVSDDDVRNLAQAFVNSSNNGDYVSFFDNYVDFDKIEALYDAGIAGRNAPKAFVRDVKKQLKGEQARSMLRGGVVKAVPIGTLVYGGPFRSATTVGPTIRVEQENGGIDYFVGRCVPQKGDGLPVIGDVFIASGGGAINEILASALIDLTPAADERQTERQEAFQTMQSAIQSGDVAGAIAAYEKGSFARYKAPSIDAPYLAALHNQWNQADDESEAARFAQKIYDASTAIRADRPNFIGGDLLLINGMFVGLPTESGLRSLEAVRRVVGDDPYLDFVEGALYVKSEPKRAATLFRAAGRKKLRSLNYLAAYYLLYETTPDASKAGMKKLRETGVKLYGDRFDATLKEARAAM